MASTSPPSRVIRRFAPLDPELQGRSEVGKATTLKAIVFDVDGTLCLPQNYMFASMRAALGIPKSVDILDHIYSLPASDGAQSAAMEKVKDIERAAMASQTPQPGLSPLMSYLEERGVPKAICTRNFNGPVEHLLAKFLPGREFRPVVTRDFRPPKPDPAGILHIAKELGVERVEGGAEDGLLPVIMVGDSVDDMLAGRRAGAATVLLENPENRHLADHEATDLVIGGLDELVGVLDGGFVSRG